MQLYGELCTGSWSLYAFVVSFFKVCSLSILSTKIPFCFFVVVLFRARCDMRGARYVYENRDEIHHIHRQRGGGAFIVTTGPSFSSTMILSKLHPCKSSSINTPLAFPVKESDSFQVLLFSTCSFKASLTCF